MYHSTMFEDMGFHYYGPFDGNNEPELEGILRDIHRQPGPHFLHVVTKRARAMPRLKATPVTSMVFRPLIWSTASRNVLNKEGAENQKICAITAAMKYGTGLQFFAHTIPSVSLMWAWQSSML